MTTYVTRTALIEARFWSGLASAEECFEIADWAGGTFYSEVGHFDKNYYWVIEIPGQPWIRPNNYLIKDDGIITTMTKETFELRYVKLEDA